MSPGLLSFAVLQEFVSKMLPPYLVAKPSHKDQSYMHSDQSRVICFVLSCNRKFSHQILQNLSDDKLIKVQET
uniref:Uncharacterized protein n=1 Tax=Rhizophora mucronata TaxID=61149 RepID=A0A2P2NZF0_RHIMU